MDESRMEAQRTPLYPLYKEYGAKTVDFSGWEMPVQFSSILQEHEAVRTQVGLFDVSHMGEFDVRGKEAKDFLQYMITNDMNRLTPGRALYSPICYDDGGTVDDLLVYKLAEEQFMVVVNAGNIQKDFDWFAQHASRFDVSLKNVSNDIALLALQGPKAHEVLQPFVEQPLSEIRPFRFTHLKSVSEGAIVSRTGYTGEDGFEVYLPAADAPALWKALLTPREGTVVPVPCGLGARDTLRLEARLPLYGHELSAKITPLEAGVDFAVKLKKEGDFIGRGPLVKQAEEGFKHKIVGLQVEGRGIPRSEYAVQVNGKQVGVVTSGTMSPTLHVPIALALVDIAYCEIGTAVDVLIRNQPVAAKVVETPFYHKA